MDMRIEHRKGVRFTSERLHWKKITGRDNTPLQNLSSKRNWATGVVLGSMIGSLKYLKRKWPQLDIQRALWALEMIELQIDQMWYDMRDEVKLNLTNKEGVQDAGTQIGTEDMGRQRECGSPQDLPQHGTGSQE